MKPLPYLAKGIVGLFIGSVTILSFQNCSPQGQFSTLDSASLSSAGGAIKSSTGGLLSENNAASGSGDSSMPGVATSDFVTPRIVFSANYNGPAQKFFSPKQRIYGTVYGLGSKNIYVCMGSTGVSRCEFQPNYVYPNQLSDIWPVEKLSTWRYEPADGTWRFALDYSEIGDIVDKVTVYEFLPEEVTDGNYLNLAVNRLRLEAMVYVRSQPQEAGVYFVDGGSMAYVDYYPNHPDQIKYRALFSGSSQYAGIVTKITGMSSNVVVCLEKSGSGRCNSGAGWVGLQASGNPQIKYSAPRREWFLGSGYVMPIESLGAVGGSYTVYAKDNSTGAVVSSSTYIRPQNVMCSFRSTTAVVGPCSDPEVQKTQCTQSNVGQTIQGTGTCKAQYTCQCN